jgi:DNA-binding response OmpR family regulator
MDSDKKKPIGSILLKQHAVSARQLEEALKRGKRGDPPLVSRLTEDGIIRETQALKALSEQSGCPGIDLNQVVIRLDDLRLLPREVAERHTLVPVLVKGNRMFLAMADPSDRQVLEEIEMMTGKRAFPYISLKQMLRRVIAEAYDLRDKGNTHYIGPKCSEETMRKAGVSRTPGRRSRAAPVDEAPSAQLERRLRPSHPNLPVPTPVIIDDAMAAAAPHGPVAVDEPTYAHLELPAAHRLPAAQRRKKPSKPPAARTRHKKSLLVVDDDAETRSLVVSVFRERGYAVLETDRGDSALQMVRETPPDIIIVEATLPKVHGFQVARELKGSERYRGIRIVMVSGLYRGWRFAEDVKANYGVDAFVEKPFQLDDLVHVVENVPREIAQPVPAEGTSETFLAAGIAAFKAGRIDEAVAQLRAGVEADPLAFRLHFHLGLLYGKLGQLYDAIQELETTLSIRPDFFPALKNLAVLYQNAGFRNKAIEMWERCLLNAPDEETRDSIKRLLVAVL